MVYSGITSNPPRRLVFNRAGVCAVRFAMWCLVLCFVAGAQSGLAAQSNEFLDAVIEREAVTWDDTLMLVLGSSFRSRLEPGRRDIETLVAQRPDIVPPGIDDRSEPITIGEFANVLMRFFGIPGGLMYRLFPGPRYAYRELRSLGLIRAPADQFQTLSGYRALTIIDRVIRYVEGE